MSMNRWSQAAIILIPIFTFLLYWAVFTILSSLSIRWISSRITHLRQLRTTAINAEILIVSMEDPANVTTLGGGIDKEIARICLLLVKKWGNGLRRIMWALEYISAMFVVAPVMKMALSLRGRLSVLWAVVRKRDGRRSEDTGEVDQRGGVGDNGLQV